MNLADLKDRVIGSGKISTVVGLIGSAAIMGAADYFASSGGSLDWKGYAVAGGCSAASAVAGAWYRKKF